MEPPKDTLETSPCFAIAFSAPLVIQNFLPDAYRLEYNFKCEPVTSKGSSKHNSSSKDSREDGKSHKEAAADSEKSSANLRSNHRGGNAGGAYDDEELSLRGSQWNTSLMQKVRREE